ncbi:MAG: glutathione S-transferase domain-containing protein [Pseudomonadota bacterium]
MRFIPEDPVIAFVNYLLEDYGDEWLTKAMFHYRWHYAEDIAMAGSVLPHYADVSVPDAQIAQMQQAFSERQISRLYVVGSNPQTASVIEASYQRFLGCLNAHLKEFPFLLGHRPGSADFACFGQLTQLAQFDPTPATLTARDYPRVHAWVSKMEDLSGLDPQADDFFAPGEIPQTLLALLQELGRTYVPVMLANASALDRGLAQVEAEVDGQPWVQEPFPYQGKCLQWLRIEYARLSADDRARVDTLLDASGCAALVVRPDAAS